jgi:hypothetical protein
MPLEILFQSFSTHVFHKIMGLWDYGIMDITYNRGDEATEKDNSGHNYEAGSEVLLQSCLRLQRKILTLIIIALIKYQNSQTRLTQNKMHDNIFVKSNDNFRPKQKNIPWERAAVWQTCTPAPLRSQQHPRCLSQCS